MSYKEKLRQKYLNFRENLDPVFIKEASQKITESFLNLNQLKEKKNILVYISFNSEVITDNLIQKILARDKRVFVPYCLKEKKKLKIAPIKEYPADLRTGAYGIKEPKEELKRNEYSPQMLELIIVPGVAFSRFGYRIGYGGGYYDRFLSELNSKPLTAGFTFSSLLVETLPIDRHDIPVNIIITEQGIVDCRKAHK